MKSIRNIAFSALLTIGALSAVTYTACNKDECKDVVCLNSGVCNGGTCSCPTGYEGADCGTKTRDKFVGTWDGSDVCGVKTYAITLTVAASSDNVSALINNPGGFGSAIVITGTVTGTNTLTFTNASVGNGRTLTGTMTFNNNAMTFAYNVKDNLGGTDNCNGTYVKK